MKESWNSGPKFGDIFIASLSQDGSVQGGRRPVLIFQNNIGNKHSPNVAVLPITSRIKKKRQITHVILPAVETGLAVDSMVLCENPLCVPKDSLENYITSLPDSFLAKIARANLYASASIAYLTMDDLKEIQKKSYGLNSDCFCFGGR